MAVEPHTMQELAWQVGSRLWVAKTTPLPKKGAYIPTDVVVIVMDPPPPSDRSWNMTTPLWGRGAQLVLDWTITGQFPEAGLFGTGSCNVWLTWSGGVTLPSSQ